MQKVNKEDSFRRTRLYASVVSAVAGAVMLTATGPVNAQAALEEIVVTAQRRSESMQDVPISLEAVTGDMMQKQGYRALDELALFTPTVIVEPEHLRPSMSVRGLGAATTDAFSVEQSTPIFLDGVHFARTSMIKLSFLDVQQVEILKGPQPVYFGQNAIAGAFNITTRKPTPEWEGYVDASVGSFNTKVAEAAIGGPINDTWGIRVAGKYDSSEGYLHDIVSDASFPDYENLAGRVLLQWTPNEKFQATAKFDMADQDKGAEGTGICIRTSSTEPQVGNEDFDHQAVWVQPPLGTADQHGVPFKPLVDCEDHTNQGRSSNGPFFAPDGSYLENGNRNAIDIREAGNQLFMDRFGVNMTEGFEKLTPWSTYLDLKYELDNGIVLSSLTSYDEYERVTNRENRYALMVANVQYRDHDFRAYSQEFRISSAEGEDWNWMTGVYLQDIDEESVFLGVRGNTDQPIRTKFYEGTGLWRSAFANVSYDALFDGKVSISVGARYSSVKKDTKIWGYYDTWIMEDPITGDPTELPYACRPSTGCPGYNSLTGYWQGATALGYTTTHLPTSDPSLPINSRSPAWDDIDQPAGRARATELDPQIVLSFRPNDNHTTYVKYVESFKAGGADGSIATFPTVRRTGDVNPYSPTGPSTAFEFGPEYAYHWEIGAKGTLFDGTMRYDISAFDTKIKGLQIGTTQALSNNSFISFGNAGEQRVKGIEFAVDYAATDYLTLNFGGVVMDNTMVDFLSTCTEVEFENPGESGCDVANSTIDRSGERGANAPVWKFVLNADYEIPVWTNYLFGVNALGFVSDGYITDNTGFSKTEMMDDHGDLSLNASISDAEKDWTWSVYARNLLHPREKYFPENDIDPQPVSTINLDTKHFAAYGIKFRYNFGN